VHHGQYVLLVVSVGALPLAHPPQDGVEHGTHVHVGHAVPVAVG